MPQSRFHRRLTGVDLLFAKSRHPWIESKQNTHHFGKSRIGEMKKSQRNLSLLEIHQWRSPITLTYERILFMSFVRTMVKTIETIITSVCDNDERRDETYAE
jgi:hypothetical protein